MLIRFSVENFLSFKDEVEFSMVAGRTRKHKDHILTSGKRNDIRLLKTGVIYGANASGKSNLIKAMAFAKHLIVAGTSPRESITVVPFMLDSTYESRSSRFQFEIKCDSKAFVYGFELDSRRIYSEWLSEIRPSSEKTLFERVSNDKGLTVVNFGEIPYTKEHDESFLQFTAKGTRPNQLYLTESIERNIKYFENIYNWFDDSLVLIFPESKPEDFGIKFASNPKFQQEFRKLINVFDLGINDIVFQPIDFDSELPLPPAIKERIKLDLDKFLHDSDSRTIFQIKGLNNILFVIEDGNINTYKFVTVHRIEHEDRNAHFETFQESDGTQRLFEITPALLDLIGSSGERVFVIDELDRQLHAHMTYNILDIFLTNSVNKSSQLIVTTHESSLLDLDLLRRDEIWFLEKDAKGVSSLFSLEEFQLNPNMDIEKGYLGGRFGAIPVLSIFDELEWAE